MRANALLIATALALAAAPALAEERGTPAQAQALAERAAKRIAEIGAEQAIKEFNDPAGGFVLGDIFPFVYAPDGKTECCSNMRALVGRDARSFKDSDGKEFGKEIINLANERGTGWVSYRMTNPVTRKIEDKVTYIIKVDGYIVGVGAYRQ